MLSQNQQTKTKQLLAYTLKLYKHSTVFNLAKLAFLTDCLAIEKTQERISSFHYELYSFGPFDESIFTSLENLISDQTIKSHINYTRTGQEYVTYAFNDNFLADDLKFKNERMPDIPLTELYLIQDILYQMFYYTEKDLTRLIYNTKPMKAIGATPDGLEGLGQALDLNAHQVGKPN